uniref:Secreted protein n=1 Tax=Phakopsora pachyrhizi TaxID=170000 RepID=A0A0S1MJZ9_PHAPC
MYRKSFSSLMFFLYLLCTFSLAASHPKNGSDNAGNRGNGEIVERKYEDYQVTLQKY